VASAADLRPQRDEKKKKKRKKKERKKKKNSKKKEMGHPALPPARQV
jgi:hypothetical protein